MNRHFWQACARGAGFSFVELLVTIIIAGIVFAALVPVFVGAQKVSSGEQIRNAALQLAQDKLEKVRGLDYDVITTANLESSTFGSGQFGTTVTWATGGGGNRSFSIDYQVDLLPEGSTAGSESYKQVTITTSWTAPPSPVKPIQLSTMISKQYAGPQINRFDVGPSAVLESTSGSTTIVSGPVVLDAYISPDDIASMNQAAAEANRGYVLFSVTSLNGDEVVSQKVTVPVSGQPAHYQFSWDNSAAEDGIYILQAVGVAGFGSRTQGMPVSIALPYSDHAPPAPTDLEAMAGSSVVYLTWVTPSAGDLERFELERSTDGVTFAKVADVDVTSSSYTDEGLDNGTTYYYRVRAVDTEGISGPYSNIASATPDVPQDTVAPSVPSPLVATADVSAPTVHLSWPISVDGGDPLSGMAGYILERSTNGADWVEMLSLYEGNTYDDTTAGWSQTWWYRVKAVDLAGNASAYASGGPVTTAALVLRSIKVTNNSSSQMYVWVQNAVTSDWYSTTGTASATRPLSGVWVKKNGNSATWNNLPSGIYNVYFLSSQTWNASNVKKTQVVNVNGGNGTATYP